MSNAIADAYALGAIQSTAFTQTSTSDVITNADAQKKIRVHSIILNVSAAISVNFTDGTGGTALEGVQAYAANGGYTRDQPPPSFVFECSAGNDLELTQSGAGTVAGSITYSLVAVEESNTGGSPG